MKRVSVSPRRRPSILTSESGLIVADFIFAITLTAGMSILLFSISYALAVVEVTQYVSFSVARSYMAGNKDYNEQESKAQTKYRALTTGKTAVSALYNGVWFKAGNVDRLDLRGGPSGGSGRTFSSDLGGGTDGRGLFIGVGVPLNFPILKLNLPLIGDTFPDVEDDGPASSVNTMLIREPTSAECQSFMEQRRGALKNLPSGQRFYETGSYIRMEDNGC